jgi:hypothetical protein
VTACGFTIKIPVMNNSYTKFPSASLMLSVFFFTLASCSSSPDMKADARTGSSAQHQEEEKEPFRPPYMESYRRGGDELRFIAVAHEGGWGPTHVTIEKAWQELTPALVIIEGIDSDANSTSEKIISRRIKLCANLDSKICDEGSYAVDLATRSGVPILGGEPSEREIRKGALAAGFSIDDMLGFYVVRQIPEWTRDGTFREENLSDRVNRFIQDCAGKFGEDTKFDWQRFSVWYKQKTGKEFAVGQITTEDPAPISGPGTTIINAISRAVENIRNKHLISEIFRVLPTYKNLLIVYGQGHLKETRPIFREKLGRATQSKQFVKIP